MYAEDMLLGVTPRRPFVSIIVMNGNKNIHCLENVVQATNYLKNNNKKKEGSNNRSSVLWKRKDKKNRANI